MPDHRRHRGAHPEDARLFGEEALPALRRAVDDLSWLLGRGYPVRAALALVGDRASLAERQRVAVRRCACSEAQRRERLARRATPQVRPDAPPVWIDGFNVVTSVEAALGGGVLLLARDGALRDMASVHGSYRLVEETRPALEAIAETIEALGSPPCRWLLDAPVSNSGRLGVALRELARQRGLAWEVEVRRDPDGLLESAPPDVLVASADSRVMDAAPRTWQLARETIARIDPEPWIVDLRGEEGEEAVF
ncbi:MAG: DUF434 domain-containing protein [Deltaproteobacteria bacterium]|nr:DUF434 domain-containing protein [Deltaproteobacteria bacterium]